MVTFLLRVFFLKKFREKILQKEEEIKREI